MVLMRALLILLLICTAALVRGQTTASGDAGTTATRTQSGRLLRIGYLQREQTGQPNEAQLERLRDALLADPRLTAQLRAANYNGIGLFPADGASDMRRRLAQREFDLAFTPANLYYDERASYVPILKAQRPDDFISPPPRDRVYRLGVVFASPRSSLFSAPQLNAETVRQGLERQRFAVVRTQSVAGFNAPLYILSADYNLNVFDLEYIWFDNSEEVVKAVLSGLADVGATELTAIDAVLRREGLIDNRSSLVREIVTTGPIITDPVVVRGALDPRNSALGRTLRTQIREFSLSNGFDGLQYRESDEREYRSLVELMRAYNTYIGEVKP